MSFFVGKPFTMKDTGVLDFWPFSFQLAVDNMKTITSILGVLAATAIIGCSSSDEDLTNTVPELTAPSSLATLRIGVKAVQLSWSDNSVSEDAFAVERRLGTGAFTHVLFVPTDVSTAVDSVGLITGNTYIYRVRALRFHESSPFSDTASATLSLPFP